MQIIILGIIDENIIPNPKSDYGTSKLLAEQYLLKKNKSDKSLYILRPCMIHGPYNKGNLTLFINFLQKGFPFPLGEYKNHRSFLSITKFNFRFK